MLPMIPQNSSPGRTICGSIATGSPPEPSTGVYGCHRWSPRTICGAVGGPPCHKWSPLNYPYRNNVCKGTTWFVRQY